MRRRAVLAVLVVSSVAWATSKELTGRAWLSRVPRMPASAEQAYREWSDSDGQLSVAGEPRALEDDMKARGSDLGASAMVAAGGPDPAMQFERAFANATGCGR